MKKIISGIRRITVIVLAAIMTLQPVTVFAEDGEYEEYDEESGYTIVRDADGNEIWRYCFEPCAPLVVEKKEIKVKYVDYVHTTGYDEPVIYEVGYRCYEHNWDGGTVATESTYAAPGEMVYTCTVCGETKTEVIPQLECTDHIWNEGSVTKESTYLAPGEKVFTCTLCGQTKTEAIPQLVCSSHKWDAGKTVKESTCDKEGMKKYTCSNCGAEKDEVIPKTDHDAEWVVTKEATDKQEGEKELRCKVCKTVLKKEKIEKTKKECDHPFPRKKVQKVAPTCTRREVVDVYCNECGELIQKDLILYTNEENHPNLQTKIVKEATYEEPGIIRYFCKDCGYEVEDEIERLHCDHPSTTIYEHPDTGKRFVKCTVCKRLLREYDDELVTNCSHTGYGQKEVCVQATDETHWGEYNYVCANCGKVMSTKKVHPYSTYTVVDENGETVTLYGWFDDAYAQEVFDLTNEYRVANGLNALKYNTAQQDASNTRALEAAVYFDHYRPTGGKWNTLSEAWKYGGENLAKGQDDPEWVMRSWKNSDGHNKNLLYGKEAGQTRFGGLSVGCFRLLRFNNSYKPSVPTEIVVWVQNFTF